MKKFVFLLGALYSCGSNQYVLPPPADTGIEPGNYTVTLSKLDDSTCGFFPEQKTEIWTFYDDDGGCLVFVDGMSLSSEDCSSFYGDKIINGNPWDVSIIVEAVIFYDGVSQFEGSAALSVDTGLEKCVDLAELKGEKYVPEDNE